MYTERPRIYLDCNNGLNVVPKYHPYAVGYEAIGEAVSAGGQAVVDFTIEHPRATKAIKAATVIIFANMMVQEADRILGISHIASAGGPPETPTPNTATIFSECQDTVKNFVNQVATPRARKTVDAALKCVNNLAPTVRALLTETSAPTGTPTLIAKNLANTEAASTDTAMSYMFLAAATGVLGGAWFWASGREKSRKQAAARVREEQIVRAQKLKAEEEAKAREWQRWKYYAVRNASSHSEAFQAAAAACGIDDINTINFNNPPDDLADLCHDLVHRPAEFNVRLHKIIGQRVNADIIKQLKDHDIRLGSLEDSQSQLEALVEELDSRANRSDQRLESHDAQLLKTARMLIILQHWLKSTDSKVWKE